MKQNQIKKYFVFWVTPTSAHSYSLRGEMIICLRKSIFGSPLNRLWPQKKTRNMFKYILPNPEPISMHNCDCVISSMVMYG